MTNPAPALSAAIATLLLTTTSCTDTDAKSAPPVASEQTKPDQPRVEPGTGKPVEPNPARRDPNDLIPPPATYCEPDDSPPAVRPIVDIVQDGRVFCGGKLWFDPAATPHNYTKMLALLLHLRGQPGVTKQRERIGGQPLELVDDPILIRADRNTEWHYIGKFMEQCSRPKAAFWKIELGVSEPGTEDPGGGAKVPAYLPKDTSEPEPIERLRVKIVCTQWGTEIPRTRAGEKTGDSAGRRPAFDLKGHEIHWQVGPKKVGTAKELGAAVSSIMRDRKSWVQDGNTGRKKPMQMVIEPGVATTYGDVAKTLDVVFGADVVDITFGGGLGARKR